MRPGASRARLAHAEREVRGLTAFRDHVLRILEQVKDLDLAAAMIETAAESMEFSQRRQQARRAADARWSHTRHSSSQDTGQHAEHSDARYAQHVAKPAKSLPAAKQDARQHAQHGLPLGSPSGSVSSPDLFSASGSGARDPRATTPVAPPPKTKAAPGFDGFWAAYPRKVGKAAARRAWERQAPPLDRVLATLAWQTKAADWTKDGGLYIPHPTTWLNRGSWDDEPAKNGASGGRFVVPAPGEGDYGPLGKQEI